MSDRTLRQALPLSFTPAELREFTMTSQVGRLRLAGPLSTSTPLASGFNVMIQPLLGPGPATARAPTVAVAMFRARMKKVGVGRLMSTSTNLLLPTLNPLVGGRLTATVILFVPCVKPLAAAAAWVTATTWVLVEFLSTSRAPATAALSAAAVMRRR